MITSPVTPDHRETLEAEKSNIGLRVPNRFKWGCRRGTEPRALLSSFSQAAGDVSQAAAGYTPGVIGAGASFSSLGKRLGVGVIDGRSSSTSMVLSSTRLPGTHCSTA